ncbi:MAG: hypothetical protein HY690_03225 [Chloroflexi bacterium]|nr:hypothetical protein [Chloroflexota bacterium]
MGSRSGSDRAALRPGALSSGPRACVLYLDTNLLLDFPELERYRGEYSQLTLVVLDAVVRELEGLRRGRDDTAVRAQRAWLALEALRRRPGARGGVALGRSGHLVRFEPGQGNADALLVEHAAAALQRQPEAAVAVVTRDRALADQARAGHVPVVQVHGTFDNVQFQRAVRDALAEARWRA